MIFLNKYQIFNSYKLFYEIILWNEILWNLFYEIQFYFSIPWLLELRLFENFIISCTFTYIFAHISE